MQVSLWDGGKFKDPVRKRSPIAKVVRRVSLEGKDDIITQSNAILFLESFEVRWDHKY